MQTKLLIKLSAYCFVYFFCKTLGVLNNFIASLQRTIIGYPIPKSQRGKVLSNSTLFINFFVVVIKKNFFQRPKSSMPKGAKVISMYLTGPLSVFANLSSGFKIESPFLEQTKLMLDIKFMLVPLRKF